MNQPHNTELEYARARWHDANDHISVAANHGNPPDPHLFAALLDARAGWWDHLGHLIDRAGSAGPDGIRDVYAIACSYAGILDRTDAARVRYRYRIPTLHPSSVASLIRLNDNRCGACGRPWLLDPTGACPECPALLYGITPMNATEASTYPPGRPWTPEHTLGQEDVSTARHERGRGEPLTEAEWIALRELAWSPVFEPPAGIPERARHDALRLALGEAERLAGRARTHRHAVDELYMTLARHRVTVVVDDAGQTPKLYTDLMEWLAVNVEREIARLHEQGINQLPNKIPARVKPDEAAAENPQHDRPRKRTVPERIDFWAEKLSDQLGNQLGNASAHGLLVTLGCAVVGLRTIASELRSETAEHQQRLRDRAEAVELLGHFVDHEDTPCRLDHNGYCQEHGLSNPCDVPAARALLARIRGEQKADHG